MGEPLPFPSSDRSFPPSVPPSIAKLHTGKTDTRRETDGEQAARSPTLANSILLSEIMAEDWMAMAVVCNLLRMEGGKYRLAHERTARDRGRRNGEMGSMLHGENLLHPSSRHAWSPL